MDFSLTRTDVVIALGGGVVGDLAGFAAATILRGVDFIQIPTTLLAQVDSSVGGKVAVDLDHGKNLAGAFWQPKLVLMDPDTLDTLDDKTFADGMAEVIKYGCIRRRRLFDHLTAHPSRLAITSDIESVLYICCDIKRIVVEEDELDTGHRMLLNFGHTIGHAYELAGHYETWDPRSGGSRGDGHGGKARGVSGSNSGGCARQGGGPLRRLWPAHCHPLRHPNLYCRHLPGQKGCRGGHLGHSSGGAGPRRGP